MTTGKQRVCSCVTVFVAFAFLTPSASAVPLWQWYLYVDDNAPNDPGPGDPTVSDPLEDGSFEHPFDAIQEAIDAASDGDEVVILEGTYTGDGNRDLDFSNDLPEGQTRAIIVRSTNPEDPDVVAATVIDCQGTKDDPHRGFTFHSGETAGSVLVGLTVTNGYAPEEEIRGYMRSVGGAVFCIGSSPTIENCVFDGNTAYSYGGGMFSYESNPTLTNCTFSGNWADYGAGGMLNWYSSPTMTNCTFSQNETSKS